LISNRPIRTSKSPGTLCRGFFRGSISGTGFIYCKKCTLSASTAKQFPIPMTWSGVASSNSNDQEAEPAMNSRINDNSEQIDRKTSRSICDAVGERLQQNLRPESLRPSSYLQHLVDELRRRDDEVGPTSSN